MDKQTFNTLPAKARNATTNAYKRVQFAIHARAMKKKAVAKKDKDKPKVFEVHHETERAREAILAALAGGNYDEESLHKIGADRISLTAADLFPAIDPTCAMCEFGGEPHEH